MIIKDNNNEFRISWQYTGTSTLCILQGIDSTNGKVFLQLSKASQCGKKDQFCRATGRKIALAKLLTIKEADDDSIHLFDRDFRIKVWEKYRTLTKVPRWKTAKDREMDEVKAR